MRRLAIVILVLITLFMGTLGWILGRPDMLAPNAAALAAPPSDSASSPNPTAPPNAPASSPGDTVSSPTSTASPSAAPLTPGSELAPPAPASGGGAVPRTTVLPVPRGSLRSE